MSSISGETAALRLAQIVHSVRFEDLPVEAISYTKTLILDSIGCLIGGFHSTPAEISRRMMLNLGGTAEATVIGTEQRTSAPLAVLANGTALRYLDFSHGYSRRDSSHPSGNFPVALALAEALHRSGREFISAMIAGYEVHLRLCNFSGKPNLKARGWHHSCNLQFSAAATASRLLVDDAVVTANAIAIAGSHCNTLAQIQHGQIAMIKATAEGWVAKCAVEAALLASYGLTGPEHIFEGHMGFASVVAGDVDFELLLAPIKDKYFLNEVRIKPFAAVGPAAAPIQAAVELHQTGDVDPTQIEEIIVRLPAQVVSDPAAAEGKRYPQNRETADHSYYYTPVIALLEGDCGEAQYAPDKLRSPVVKGLLAKVKLEAAPELTAQWPQASGGGLRVHMRDGRILERFHAITPGHPRNPLGRTQIESKFERQMSSLYPKRRVSQIKSAINDLDACNDVSEFSRLLAYP